MGRCPSPTPTTSPPGTPTWARCPTRTGCGPGCSGLPPHVLSTSALTGRGPRRGGRLLALGPGDVLLDLACGRAGYGLELVGALGRPARRARLRRAPRSSRPAPTPTRLGLADRADLRVGDMTATGLHPASVTAVLCVDAAQFPADFARDLRRGAPGARPGGLAVFTGWEARDPQDPAAPERIRRVDLAAGLRRPASVDVRSRSRGLAGRRSRRWRAVVALPRVRRPGDAVAAGRGPALDRARRRLPAGAGVGRRAGVSRPAESDGRSAARRRNPRRCRRDGCARLVGRASGWWKGA